MTEEKAKEWLNRGWALNEQINKKLEEQYSALSTACNATSCIGNEKVQTSHKNATEGILARYIELSNEIDNLTDELYEVKREILAVIKKVPNRFYRKLLYWSCFLPKGLDMDSRENKNIKRIYQKVSLHKGCR